MSPPQAAIRPCGTVPMPLPPHQRGLGVGGDADGARRCGRRSRRRSAPGSGRSAPGRRGSACRRRPRPPRARCVAIRVRRAQHAEVDRLEVGEEAVVALDRQHRLPRLRPRRRRTARARRARPSRGSHARASALPRSGPRTASAWRAPRRCRPSTARSCFWKTCIVTRGCRSCASSTRLRAVEVGVRVVALPQALDGQGEDLGRRARVRHVSGPPGAVTSPEPGVQLGRARCRA